MNVLKLMKCGKDEPETVTESDEGDQEEMMLRG